MSTVQSQVLRLLQRIDPTLKTTAVITASNISTWASDGGDKFTAQRVVDIYNDARIALFQSMRQSMPIDRLTKELSLAQLSVNIVFTATGDSWVYTLPAGYLRFVSLSGRYLLSAVSTALAPIFLLESTFRDAVLYGTNPYYTQSNNNRFVFERAGTLYGIKAASSSTLLDYIPISGVVSTTSGSAVVTGVTSTSFTTQLSEGSYIKVGSETKIVQSITSDTSLTCTSTFSTSNASIAASVADYKLSYFGLATFILADVTGGTTTETVNEDYMPVVIELAVAIANGLGNNAVNELAKKLIEMKA
jgi:hypothetical protein